MGFCKRGIRTPHPHIGEENVLFYQTRGARLFGTKHKNSAGFRGKLRKAYPNRHPSNQSNCQRCAITGCCIILSSPYTRAMQTAAILSKELGIDIAVETDLHEWVANKNYIYEPDEIAKTAYQEYEANQGNYPEGTEKIWEDAATIQKRVLKVLDNYSGYQKVIVVCHGMLIQAVTQGNHPQCGEIVEFHYPQV